jgi:peptidyl-prolyl cis-trans isomerase SurA
MPLRNLIAATLALGFAFGVTLAPPEAGASDMSYVVKVNGEPITSYDVSQRQKLMALTSGALGKRMRALLKSPSTQEKFQEYVKERRPSSRAEAEALQKQFVNQLQKKVVADINKKTRSEAIEELIDERLMLQEAKQQKVSVSDAEIDKRLTAMAKSGNEDRSLQQFLEAFKKQGINPKTMKQRIRAQLAWRDVIRKIYGFRIASLVGTGDAASDSGAAVTGDATFDVRRVQIPASGSGQAAIARAYSQSETLRKQFSSCAKLTELTGRISGASLERISGKKASAFPRDTRPLLIKASAGQMLPPVLTSGGVELYAVCAKDTPQAETAEKQDGKSASDRRQQEFQIYARRHLTDLRKDALIERR